MMENCICGQPISGKWLVCPMCGLHLRTDLLKYQVQFMGLTPCCGKPISGKGGVGIGIRFDPPFYGYQCCNEACAGNRFLVIKLIVSDPKHYLDNAKKYHSAKAIQSKLDALTAREIDL